MIDLEVKIDLEKIATGSGITLELISSFCPWVMSTTNHTSKLCVNTSDVVYIAWWRKWDVEIFDNSWVLEPVQIIAPWDALFNGASEKKGSYL